MQKQSMTKGRNVVLRKIAQIKIYFQRVQTYLSIISVLMIASMFIDSLGLNVSIPIKIIILASVVLGALLWGYLDTKLGLFRIEQEKINTQVPQLYTIINLLVEIKNKLNGTT